MDDLNALFDSVEGLSEDLKEYGTMAAAAIGANMVWNMAVARLVPANMLSPQVRRYVLPAAAILAGIYGGRKLSRSMNRRVGLGVTVGLVTAGVSSLVRQFFPSLPLPGVAGLEDYGYAGLFGAPVTYEDYGVSGGPITVEEAGVGAYGVEDDAGYASVMTG